jgi:dephospho-CoA kinase
MAIVLVTGVSGTGKSTVLAELGQRGHRVVDTDYGGWSEIVPMDEPPGWEQLWREDRIEELIAGHGEGALFLSGCVANQGRFYARFDAVVLLSAPAAVILERVAARQTNPFGKSAAERELISQHLAAVEPRLRATATHEIDTQRAVAEVADELEAIALGQGSQPSR